MPSSAARNPEITSNSVVLPAPFGPMKPTISPADRRRARRRSARRARRSASTRRRGRAGSVAGRRAPFVVPFAVAARLDDRARSSTRSRTRRRPIAARSSARACRVAAPSRNTERSTSGRSSSSAVGPWNRISPFSMKYAVSAIVSARFTDCSTRMIVVPCAAMSRTSGSSCSTIVGREAERQLVDHQQARLLDERHAEREHLLLAAREVAGRLVEPVAQDREQLEHVLGRLGHVLLVLAVQPAREPEVLGDGQRREHALRRRAPARRRARRPRSAARRSCRARRTRPRRSSPRRGPRSP